MAQQLKRKELRTGAPLRGAGALPSLMTEARLPGNEQACAALDGLVAADPRWNFYSPLSGDKMIELIASIQEKGLLHPIVVWRRPGQKDMVLSGHNRLEAYRRLYQETHDERYARIPCTVRTNLTPEQAREIIVDSNWVQRNLTPSEKARSICQKYALAGRKTRAANGADHQSTYDIIARQYGLSGRQIARYIKLGSLNDDLLALLDGGRIGVSAGVRLADFSEEQQQLAARLITQHGLKPAQLAALNPGMSQEELTAVLSPAPGKKAAVSRVSVEVPSELKEEFLAMAEAWLAEKERRT